jgi:hypothetical protein
VADGPFCFHSNHSSGDWEGIKKERGEQVDVEKTGGELSVASKRYILIEAHANRNWEEGLGQAVQRRKAVLVACAAAAFIAAGAQTACRAINSEATFDRTLKVDGPVRLDVVSGSGTIVVRRGAAREVRIHGTVRVGGFRLNSRTSEAQEAAANPPIEQNGNVIRIGANRYSAGLNHVTFSFTIETPQETRLEAKNGSGVVHVEGVRGPVRIVSGSGGAEVQDVGDDVSLTLGSGGCRVTNVEGRVNFTGGSGSVAFADLKDEIRGQMGSGKIEIDRPQGRVNIQSGSGAIRVTGARQDVRASSGSGPIEIRGNPAAGSFWDLTSSSGGVELSVPSSASFALTAHTSSGGIQANLPIMIQEQSRRFLRARVGQGDARVDLQTRSGGIRISTGGGG